MTEPLPRLLVGVMSFAHVHAASYLHALASRPDVDVIATDPGGIEEPGGGRRGRALAERWGAEYVEDFAALLDRSPDAVIVTSENARHRELVELASAAGAHVLCEKPLATTVDDGEAMVAAADRSGTILMIAHPVRCSPAVESARDLVASGALGAIRGAQGTNTGQLPSGRAWFVDPVLAGGGALVDHVVHCADLLDELLDGAPADRVYAVGNTLLHPDDGLEVETAGLVAITYRGGVTATIDCSWSLPAAAPTWGGLTLRLIGEHGIVEIDPFRDRVTGTDAGGEVHIGVDAALDSLLLDRFLAAVRRAGRAVPGHRPIDPPQPDGRSGLRSLRIIDAARRSAEVGSVQRIGPVDPAVEGRP